MSNNPNIAQAPVERVETLPVTLTYTQAKRLVKKMRPPPSEKQKEHCQKLVEANRLKWEQRRQEKAAQLQREQEERERQAARVVVKPKRIYRTRVKIDAPVAQPDQDIDYDSEEEVEVIKKIKKPKKKILYKDASSDSDDDEVIQKTKKASKLVETVTKLDKAIEQLKTTNNRYDGILSKVKF